MEYRFISKQRFSMRSTIFLSVVKINKNSKKKNWPEKNPIDDDGLEIDWIKYWMEDKKKSIFSLQVPTNAMQNLVWFNIQSKF